jgi:hypothetical protein
MGNIFYQLYQPCGLFNQITSLEVAIGLSKRYNKKLFIHNISNPADPNYNYKSVPIYSANYAFNNRSHLIDSDVFPSIPDLVDWEDKEVHTLMNNKVDYFKEEDFRVENLMGYYSIRPGYETGDRELFSEGRQELDLTNYNNVHLRKTLGYYSRFFFDREPELDRSIASVRFKPEYYELAEKIAKSIGDFNGIHFRLADHKAMFDPDDSILDSGVSKIDNGLPLVMCTDQSSSNIIKDSSYNYLLLDEYILSNFDKEFREFKFKEEVSFGILNNLVMHYSKDFIGSPGSTYTGYIQRGIGQDRDIQWRVFGENEIIQTGPYSWNGYNIKDTMTKQWWREWKESRLGV